MASIELRQEDSMSLKNPYAWSKSSEPDISLDHFLTKVCETKNASNRVPERATVSPLNGSRRRHEAGKRK